MIPPWFQACIYWKKSVIWQHHFQASIFSMLVSLYHRSTWDNPYIKKTLFISQHLLQPSIIASGLWIIWEKWRVCLFEENHCSFKGAYLFRRTSCNNFCLKSTVVNAQKHLQRSHSFMVNQYSEITFIVSKVLKRSAVSKRIVNYLEEQL